MENKTALTGPVITGSFEKRAPGTRNVLFRLSSPSLKTSLLTFLCYESDDVVNCTTKMVKCLSPPSLKTSLLTFLCYESDDVVNCTTKMVKCWIKNISWNNGAVIFKLGTWNVHHRMKQNETCGALAKATLLAPVSFCQNLNIPISNPFEWDRRSCSEQTWF